MKSLFLYGAAITPVLATAPIFAPNYEYVFSRELAKIHDVVEGCCKIRFVRMTTRSGSIIF